jgi:hypothetical protein
VHFKSVFGSHSPTKPTTGNGNDVDNDGNDNDADQLDESNPFFEQQTAVEDGNPFSADDDYDESGKNPFF